MRLVYDIYVKYWVFFIHIEKLNEFYTKAKKLMKCLYGIIVSFFVYKKLNYKQILYDFSPMVASEAHFLNIEKIMMKILSI